MPSGLPATFEAFRNYHAGSTILVCGCGSSLSEVSEPGRFVTIGVNDVGRLFDPDYLVVLNGRHQFQPERWRHVHESRARALFTQLPLGIPHPHIVNLRLGARGGTRLDGATIPYTRNSPYVAVALAMHMGAARIGLIGVDFTDHHFFGSTGKHPLTRELAQIDAEYGRLFAACQQQGIELVNLSQQSRLTSLPKTTLAAFAPRPLRIVSYATTPVAGVPPVLARCIAKMTEHECRTVWSDRSYGNGVAFDGDVEYRRDPHTARQLLEAADAVIVHNGKVAPEHAALLDTKRVVTLAHNYLWNVDQRFVKRGQPDLVVAQYQATLREFAGWTPVPNPIPFWEPQYQPAEKGERITICYTPSGKHDVYPRDHKLYWHSKGYRTTMALLDRLAKKYDLDLQVIRNRQITHAESLQMKRKAHIVIDECVTGSYHRNSLEGLAAGAVVVNALSKEVEQVLKTLTNTNHPFVVATLQSLEATLEHLINDNDLVAKGNASRTWLEQNWDFKTQWQSHWRPALTQIPKQPTTTNQQRVASTPHQPPTTNHQLTTVAPATVVVPHGGQHRLRNLRLALDAIKDAEVEIVVVEMDEQPHARELAIAANARYVFVQQEGAFHKARAMNAGIPFVRTSRFFWLDSDLLLSPQFIRNALAEFDHRKLDCLVPWTSVRYLSSEDSDAIEEGRRTPAQCTPVNTYLTRHGARGGVVLVRTEFVQRYGGMCEEFRGWGGEDNAWYLKASLLGRAATSARSDQHVWHVWHPLSGGYGPAAAIQSNAHYDRNLALLHETRRLNTRDRFLARFPPPAHHPAPWLGIRRVACPEPVGKILTNWYGPAIEITPAEADLGGRPVEELARELAASV